MKGKLIRVRLGSPRSGARPRVVKAERYISTCGEGQVRTSRERGEGQPHLATKENESDSIRKLIMASKSLLKVPPSLLHSCPYFNMHFGGNELYS